MDAGAPSITLLHFFFQSDPDKQPIWEIGGSETGQHGDLHRCPERWVAGINPRIEQSWEQDEMRQPHKAIHPYLPTRERQKRAYQDRNI